MIETTFVMVKPDGVQRSLVGEILATFEHAGLTLRALTMLTPTRELVEQHYPSTTDWLSTVGYIRSSTRTPRSIDWGLPHPNTLLGPRLLQPSSHTSLYSFFLIASYRSSSSLVQ